MNARTQTVMKVVVGDMHRAVLQTMDQAHVSRLERSDFQEQFTFAEDDLARVRLCRQWLRTFRDKRVN